jgi:hypothetical protein
LERIREEVNKRNVNLDIVMVNVWEHLNSRKEAEHFCKIHNIDGTVLLDPSAEYINRLGLQGVPINVIVDKKGIVRSVGTTTPDEVKATLMKMLMPTMGR